MGHVCAVGVGIPPGVRPGRMLPQCLEAAVARFFDLDSLPACEAVPPNSLAVVAQADLAAVGGSHPIETVAVAQETIVAVGLDGRRNVSELSVAVEVGLETRLVAGELRLRDDGMGHVCSVGVGIPPGVRPGRRLPQYLEAAVARFFDLDSLCLLYTSPSPRDRT